MPRWRRLCIDVDDYDTVIGGSVEFYDDLHVVRRNILVLAPREVTDKTPEDLLGYLLDNGWLQGTLLFPEFPPPPSD